MTHIRHSMRVIAAALLATPLLALLSWPAGQAQADSPCKPSARVSGEPELVRSVVALLAKRGISASASGKCKPVAAVLASDNERTRVTITDPDGRIVERVADDVEGAATAIESWVRRDVSDPLLAARAMPALPEPAPALLPATEQLTEPDKSFDTPRFELTAAALSGIGSDGSLWIGAQAQGCGRIGPLCIGVHIRVGTDTEEFGDSAKIANERRSLDFMLYADAPWQRGRLTLSPGIAIGQSSISVERDLPDQNDDEDEYVSTLHLGAHLRSSVRIAGAWSLRVDLAVSAFPFGDPIFGDEPDEIADGEPMFAGIVRAQAWLGLGLVYSGL